MNEQKKEYDFFISHASEDKDKFVRPLANELSKLGFKIWYDEFSLKIGDSLFEEISNGIKNSDFGIVVISKNFLRKKWAQKELKGLISKEIFTGENIILPIWLDINADEVYSFSPILADKVSVPIQSNEIDKAISNILKKTKTEIITIDKIREALDYLKDCDIYERKKYILETESRIKNLVHFQEAYYDWFCSDDAFEGQDWNDFLALKKERELKNKYTLPFNVIYNPEFSSILVMNKIIRLAKKWINKNASLTEIYELIFLIDWYHEMDLPYFLFGFSQDSIINNHGVELCSSLPYLLSKNKKINEETIMKARIKIWDDYYGN